LFLDAKKTPEEFFFCFDYGANCSLLPSPCLFFNGSFYPSSTASDLVITRRTYSLLNNCALILFVGRASEFVVALFFAIALNTLVFVLTIFLLRIIGICRSPYTGTGL